MEQDVKFMQRALELARLGVGLTRPNPPVGAVLVRDGVVLSEGWHRFAGGDHAERACLQQVEGPLGDATLYVTLEPCSTTGRTPPCTDIILEKGVGRLVVAIADCNPVHAGRGLELLRAKGVEVVCGVCAEEASELLAPFAKRITTGLPFVTLKLASTLDGRIADAQGGSRWITGAAARERVQAMRREADAIMVGAGTVRADNPSLLPRPDEGRKPLRVIVGSQIPKESTVLQDEAADRTLVRGGPLKDLFEELAALGVMHILCEGGGQLAASLIEGGYVDRYQFFIAPKLMGSDGLPNLARVGGLVHEAIQLRFTKIEPLGEDLLVTAVHI